MGTTLDPGAVTALLQRWSLGDRKALEKILPLVYDELRAIGRAYMNRERPGHTLGVTGLVHETFLRLAGQRLSGKTPAPWRDRKHFYGIAARLMRQVLVDYSRQHGARKRDAGIANPPEPFPVATKSLEDDYLLLDQCLSRLEQIDPRKAAIVELRFFGGLTIQEIADAQDLSASTIKKELTLAKVWLYRNIQSGDGHDPRS